MPQSPSPGNTSVIIPAFNEELSIAATLDRIVAAFGGSPEIIVVSDGSSDRTFEVAASWLRDTGCGIAIQLASNVGSHAAIRCGLERASGDTVAIISADGQDPPEVLPQMARMVAEGMDLVWGERTGRRRDPWIRRVLAAAYYRMFRLVTGLEYPPSGFDFIVMSRHAVAALGRYRERNLPLFLAVFNLGLASATVPYQRAERVAGTSGWTISKRLRLAMDMLTSYSPAPIRMVSGVGLIIGVLGVVFGAFTVIRALRGGVPVEGWASLMVVSSLMLGTLLVAVGFIGEYLWRTLDEIRARPLFIERDVADHR